MTTVVQGSPSAPALVAPLSSVEAVDEVWAPGSGSYEIHDDLSDTERIVAAAGAVESVEWELDRAQAALAEAIERAASGGCSLEVIAQSAGMAKEDVATLLWVARSGRNLP